MLFLLGDLRKSLFFTIIRTFIDQLKSRMLYTKSQRVKGEKGTKGNVLFTVLKLLKES